MDFKELIKKDYIIFDGAMGTMLQSKGMKAGVVPDTLNITNPQMVAEVLRAYAAAGSDIVTANTFGSNRHKLDGTGYSVKEIVTAAVNIAKEAVNGYDVMIGLDVGPIGELLEPTGSLSFEEAYDIFKEEIVAGRDAGADIIVLATMTDLYEMKAAILAAKENTDLPVICNMTFETNRRTFTGCSVPALALTMAGLGADIIGANCSLGPDELVPVVDELLKWSTVPVCIKPNAGLPDPITGKFSINAEEFADAMVIFAKMGAKLLGGCCGTTPEYISLMKEKISKVKPNKSNDKIPSAVCSYAVTSVIDQPRIIGERINPTGKKLFKEALKNNDIDYILNQAVEQVRAGADILDVNVGLPDIDEKAMMVKTVKAVQSVVDVPLQIDSTIPEVLEAALRVYNGKPIVNSVNGEEESLENVLPLVKKYGAMVIGLTLDKNGIPSKAEERFAIAEKILKRALEAGIDKENIIIDCLTLTASAEQAAVRETIKAVKMVKEKLGLKTALGVSNISFGLPNRELVNRTFLTMALENGLDLPIINPNVDSMTGAVRAFKLLSNIDVNSTEYIAAYNNSQPASSQASVKEVDIAYAIDNGMKKEGALATERLLETVEPMTVINDYLIPALDKTGELFEKGKIFLPQLILSASVAQSCFDVLKKKMSSGTQINKGKVILATVKGDIHDIGKNIVKVLLENYGYTVIDLGKDVPPELICETAIKENIKLVGLSALMTTTLKSMENTIKLLREKNADCKVVVGGAVLTEDYAMKIGADFYSKNAKETVDAAKIVLG